MQRFLGKRAHGGRLQKLSNASGSDAAAWCLRFGGLRKRESKEAVLLAPRVDLPAFVHVGEKRLALERLIREGRGVVLLEPVLDVEAVVRVPIRRDNRVVHQNALKRHVLQLLCKQTASVTRQPSARISAYVKTKKQKQIPSSVHSAHANVSRASLGANLGDRAKRGGRRWGKSLY